MKHEDMFQAPSGKHFQGLMPNEAREFMDMAPRLAIFQGIAIIFAVLVFNFLGDALRDALDLGLAQR
jgi:ABC-type dipeptide/oligopeptide/nickel transport system permease subunit